MALNHSFAGKRVLITGGGSGFGRQLVHRLTADGAIVFTIDKNAESLKKLKEELPSANLTAVVCDLSNWEETKKVVEGFGVIDHLVNNAGVAPSDPILEVTEDALLNIYKVNLFAVVNVSQVIAKGLIAAGKPGSIVNVASIAARFGTLLAPAYASTKAAVENLTKSMAIELGAHNVRVNCVLPGSSDTPIISSLPEEVKKAAIPKLLERNVNKRLIEPNEIADAILFLLSPLSTMIIGEGVVVDGGYLIS